MDSQSPPTPERIPPAKIKFDPVARRQETADFPPVPVVADPPFLKCMGCGNSFPFMHFASGTDPLCETCREEAPAKELNELKARMCKDLSVKMQQAADGRLPLEHVELFLSELMYDFGGMRVFVKCWSEQLKRSFEEKPGSKTNLDQCRSIAKLVMDCNKLQHQENVLDLSDEQLRVKKELALMQILSDAAGDPHRRRMLVELMRVNGISLGDIPRLSDSMQEVANEN